MKLASLTIFFPFYNDAGTVADSIAKAYKVGTKVSHKLEVIAIHGGASQDETWREIMLAKQKFPSLRVLNRADNHEGYAVIKAGFKAAKNEWVFYTDGDAQYRIEELRKLVSVQHQTQADVVNGYKTIRHDEWDRRLLGDIFKSLYHVLVNPPVSDIHCDFRLIKRELLKRIVWKTRGSCIISELVLKLQTQGAIFAETSVTHRDREYGASNYSWYKLSLESCQELLWSLKYIYLSQRNI